MLEHLPAWLGSALHGVRAGPEKLLLAMPGLAGTASAITLSSPAFGDGGRLPERFTADGEGRSPPLVWGEVPEDAASLALIVEDADSPSRRPLVHAIVWALPATTGSLAEGAIRRDGAGSPEGGDVGRNSYLGEGWLPPDPPPGHGEHRYVFQLYALGGEVPSLPPTPGRDALAAAMAGRVLGLGVLTGLYSRREPRRGDQISAAPAST